MAFVRHPSNCEWDTQQFISVIRNSLRDLVPDGYSTRSIVEMLAATARIEKHEDGYSVKFPGYAQAIWRDTLLSQRARGEGDCGIGCLTLPHSENIIGGCVEAIVMCYLSEIEASD